MRVLSALLGFTWAGGEILSIHALPSPRHRGLQRPTVGLWPAAILRPAVSKRPAVTGYVPRRCDMTGPAAVVVNSGRWQNVSVPAAATSPPGSPAALRRGQALPVAVPRR